QRGHRANAVESCSASFEPRPPATSFNGATARTRWKGRLARSFAASLARFNGATARTRWKGKAARGYANEDNELQRGHRANAVESLETLVRKVSNKAASTGPPRERGGKTR